ncbi:hypothetical protein [Candidatus Harpocratesius sp.]
MNENVEKAIAALCYEGVKLLQIIENKLQEQTNKSIYEHAKELWPKKGKCMEVEL